MKKIIRLLMVFAFSASLFACAGFAEHDKVFSESLISFASGDSIGHVTKDITLTMSSVNVPGAELSWSSSNPEVIGIEEGIGRVKRPEEDTEVTLKLTVTISGVSREKMYQLTVLKQITDTDTDSVAPVITGTKDWTLTAGALAPDWLAGISAIDDQDGSITVSILENTTDLDVPGSYHVIYVATDKAGNRRTVTVSVTVAEEDPVSEPEETFVEHFDALAATASSYGDISFTGINNIKWTILGARGDQKMDGNAVTFGGMIDGSKLSATIEGGISSFRVDVKRAFTNTNNRELELLVNGLSVGKFAVDPNSDVTSVFEVEDINIEGSFTLELRHNTGADARAQIMLDNLMWTSYHESTIPAEKQHLDQDLAELNIISAYLDAGMIDLPVSGANGSQIAWSFLNPDDVNNALIDLSSLQVSVPASGQVTVKLVATLTNGTYQATKVFSITLGEGEPVAISVARGLANGSPVKTQGVITSCYQAGDTLYFFLQDDTAGIIVAAPSSYAQKIIIGNEIILRGIKHTINNQATIDGVVKLDLVGTKEITALVLNDPSLFAYHQGSLIEISGLLRQTYPADTLSFDLVNAKGIFTISIPSDLDLAARQAVQSVLTNKAPGLEVKVTACIGRNADAYPLMVLGSAQLMVGSDINPDLIGAVVENNHVLPEFPSKVTSDLTLPLTSDIISGIEIIWTSSDASVISNDGKVTLPETETTVRMNYEVMLQDTLVLSGYINVTVSAPSAYEGYYSSINGLTGSALKNELTRIISTMQTISYTNTSYVLDETDADPLHPGNVLLVYNRASISGEWNGSSWNKEHIWPQSKLGSASVSDLFNLRPANPSVNSLRGNLPYVDGTGTYGARSGGWYPGDAEKGDIARAILYMSTRWGLTISSSSVGSLNTFLKWNALDPVDAFESHRNDVIYQNQKNRNPYVDHPELVSEVYGSYSVNVDFSVMGTQGSAFPYFTLPLYALSPDDLRPKSTFAA